PGPSGNGHRTHAPHNVYPSAGARGSASSPENPSSPTEDQWIAIDVASDEEFAALCTVLGCLELARDPRFAEAAARKRHERELDAALAERTRHRDKFELFHALQAAGVAAGPLLSAAERLVCPQL